VIHEPLRGGISTTLGVTIRAPSLRGTRGSLALFEGEIERRNGRLARFVPDKSKVVGRGQRSLFAQQVVERFSTTMIS
jgi:hypothetical protein